MTSMRRALAAGAVLTVLALLFLPARAQTISPAQRGEIEKIIKDYLLTNPEVLQDAYNILEKRQHRAAVEPLTAALWNSTHQITLGNPKGDVTLVEFFDYNCPHCKDAVGDMLDLLKSDPKLRIVLKEYPVLGKQSVEAAKVAVAARMQDPSGAKYLEFHRKMFAHRGINDQAQALATAKEAGYDTARLEKDLDGPEIKATLQENFELADALGLGGTPAYVVGYDYFAGRVGAQALREKINDARCGKASC
ncbi:MAG TPA: DsbA family protein [Xanthobacteraceae bacterium]|nr:DsbA family protein [Xanthobacteraceae bacterium]